MKPIQVLIVEDEPLIAEDIKAALEQVGYAVTGIAFNKEQAFALLQNKTPDLALLDINLGNNTDGITIAEFINEHCKIPFLYLTSYSNKLILDKVKHTFPMGYIVKPFDEADIFTGIEIALSNFKTIKKSANFTIEHFNKHLPNPVTQREFELINDIFNGLSNNQIADKNFVSINTVKTHIQKIYEKLNCHSRAEAIVIIRTISTS